MFYEAKNKWHNMFYEAIKVYYKYETISIFHTHNIEKVI